MSQLSAQDIEAIAMRLSQMMLLGSSESGIVRATADVANGDKRSVGRSGVVEVLKKGKILSDEKEKGKESAEGVLVDQLDDGSAVRQDEKVSWADEMSEGSVGGASSVSSVEMPAGVVVSTSLRQVKFGGMADAVGLAMSAVVEEGFFARYVRVPNVFSLHKLLIDKCNVKLPKSAMEDLALVTYTTATVPVAFTKGAARLRSWAAVGDAALALVMISKMHALGTDVASVQEAKSAKLNNAAMARVFARSALSSHVSFPSGIDVVSNKLSADALEALAGIITTYRDMSAVVRFANYLGLY